MEVLLTPVVNKLLRRYIKSAEGRSGSNLRVSLSGGSVVLHNLELNLDALLQGLPVAVERAFARQLTLVIPWTSLATQPIQVLLDTVEVVLRLSDKQAVVDTHAGSSGVAGTTTGGGWMGSLTSLFMQALFNTSVSIKNIVVKYKAPHTQSMLTCGALDLYTAAGAWRLAIKNASDWLKKQLDIVDIAINITAVTSAAEGDPLLRIPRLQIGVLAPVFAVLSSRAAAGQTTASIDVDVEPVRAVISSQQVSWLRTFAESMSTVLAARGDAVKPAKVAQPAAAQPATTPVQLHQAGAPQAPRSSWLGAGTSALQQAWSFVTDEAAAVAAEGPDGVDRAVRHHVPMPRPFLHFGIQLQGGSVHFCISPGQPAQQTQVTETSTPARLLQEAATNIHSPTNPLSPIAGGGSDDAAYSGDAVTQSINDSVPFAELLWQHVQSEVSVKADTLESLKLWIQSILLQKVTSCQMSDRPEPDQPQCAQIRHTIFNINAAQDIEYAPLMDSQGQPLACHVQVKAQQSNTLQHQASVHCGAITLCHVPGFVTDCVAFANQHPNVTAPGDASGSDSASAKLIEPIAAQPNHAPTHFANITMSLSVLAVGAGALSASTSNPHAAWVNCSRLSCHLGSIRARGRQGSLVAGLFALQTGPLPERGLRISAAGIQLGIVQQWQGSIDPKTLEPSGMQLISNSFELQVLVQGWPMLQTPARSVQTQQPATATVGQVAWPTAPVWQSRSNPTEKLTVKVGPESEGSPSSTEQPSAAVQAEPSKPAKVMTCAVSSISLKLSGLQIAMISAIAGAATAESNRRFQKPLPQQGVPPESMQDQGREGWLACLSLHLAATYALYTPDNSMPSVLAQPTQALQRLFRQKAESASAGATGASDSQSKMVKILPTWVVLCDKLSVVAAVGLPGTHMPGVSLTCAQPHVWGPTGLTVQLPACDISLGEASLKQLQSSTPATGPAAGKGSHLVTPSGDSHSVNGLTPEPQDMYWQCIGTPVAVMGNTSITLDSPSNTSAENISMSISSVSVDLSSQQMSTAAQAISWTMLGPVVPILTAYPPYGQPSDSSVKLQLEVQLLFGLLNIEPATSPAAGVPLSDLAFWLVDTAVCFDKISVQAVPAQRTDLGFFPLPTTTKAAALSLSSFTLATVSKPDAPANEGEEMLDWVCRMKPSKTKRQAQPLSCTVVKVEAPGQADKVDIALSAQAIHLRLSPTFYTSSAALAVQIAQAQVACPTSDTTDADTKQSKLSMKLAVLGISLCMRAKDAVDCQQVNLSIGNAILLMRRALDTEVLGMQEMPVVHTDLSLTAVSLLVHGSGLPDGNAFIMLPADGHVSTSSSTLSRQQHVAVKAPVLALAVSPAAAACLLAVAKTLQAVEQLGPQKQVQEQVAASLNYKESHGNASEDDLRCGLYTMASMLASRPGPLKVSVGDESPGYMPWSAHGESWVGWCYPYPRPVQVVCFTTGAQLLKDSEVGLSYYEAEVDDYIPVPCRLELDPAGSLLVTAKTPVAALEWQVWWAALAPGAQCSAKTILQHLLVNPTTHCHDLPLLQPVPLTITVALSQVRLTLLIEANTDGMASPGVPQAQDLGAMKLENFQATLHKWPSAVAGALYTSLAVSYVDDATLTQEVLLEPSRIGLQVEQAPSKLSSTDSSSSAPMHRQASALPLSVWEDHMTLPIPEPRHPGLTVKCRIGDGPITFRVGQLAVDALQRLFKLASAAVHHHLLTGTADPVVTPQPKNTAQAPDQLSPHVQEQTANLQADSQHPYMIKNLCPVNLLYGQAGTDQVLRLAAHSTASYRWHTPPGFTARAERALRLACAPAQQTNSAVGEAQLPGDAARAGLGTAWDPNGRPMSPQSPLQHLGDESAAVSTTPGTGLPHNSTQLAKASAAPSSKVISTEEVLWGMTFDCTATGSHQQQLQLADELHFWVAVSVQKQGAQWLICLRPEYVVCNKLATPVHLHCTGQLAGVADALDGATFAVEPDAEVDQRLQLMPVVESGSGSSFLQVWLGSGDGWSLPLSLNHTAPQVKLLTPGSLGLGAPSSPLASHSAPSPGMWCQITPAETSTGQTSIILWPLYTLCNAMPTPLHWRLVPAADEPTEFGHSAEGLRSAGGVLQPGDECPLAVALQASQALSFQLPAGSIAMAHEQALTSPDSVSSGAAVLSARGSPPYRTGSPNPNAWSVPLEARRHAGHTEALRMFPEARRSKIMLPEAGQKLAVAIPCATAEPSNLSVTLTARSGQHQAPHVVLSVVPHAVLHNSLPIAVTLACPGLPHQATAAPSSSQALDWGPIPVKPKKAVLAVLAEGGHTLQSDPFALDADHDTQICFRESPQSHSLHQDDQLLFLAAINVHTRSVGMHPATSGSDFGHGLEVTHISITPACFVTNLTSHHLQLQMHSSALPEQRQVETETPPAEEDAGVIRAADNDHLEAGSTSVHTSTASPPCLASQWGLSCAASQTVPVLNAWRFAQPPVAWHEDPKQSAAALPRLLAQVSLSPELHHTSTGHHAIRALPSAQAYASSGPATPVVQQPGSASLSIFDVQAHTADTDLQLHDCVLLSQPCGRQHLHLNEQTEPQQRPVALAYRTLLSRGRLHLVFFLDPQPAVVVHNATSESLTVAWAIMQTKAAQHAQHSKQQQFEVAAGTSMECNPLPGLLLDSDEQEDEEAFLEAMTNPAAAAKPPLAIKIKPSLQEQWLPTLQLKPGLQQTGELSVSVKSRCATQHVTLTSSSQHTEDKTSLPEPAATVASGLIGQEQQQQQPNLQQQPQQLALQLAARLWCQIAVDCLVISVWDDERGRLLGGHSSPEGRHPAELSCIYWDNLTATCTRTPTPDRSSSEARQQTEVGLTATALQLDSFCPDSAHPVVLHSHTQDHPRGQQHPASPAFTAMLKLSQALDTSNGATPTQNFCNVWVSGLSVQLPPLAIAIDDSLMALVERCVSQFAPHNSPSQQAQASQTAAFHTPFRSNLGSSNRDGGQQVGGWMSSASSPMTLLEQARQAQRLNQVLDGITSPSRAPGRDLASAAPPAASPSQPGGASVHNLAAAALAASPAALTPSPSREFDSSPEPRTPAVRPLTWVDAQLSAELLAQAITVAAPRLLVHDFSIGRVKLLFDIHVSNAGPTISIPIALDTHRAPLRVAGVSASRLLYRPSIMLHGLLAHALAEALLSAPGMLGSLDLLFNPTGLLQSLGQAWQGLLMGPLAAIEARSPSQFVVGLGVGSASFVRQLSAWTLGSIGGFSSASSRVLARALQARPAHLEGNDGTGVLGRGLKGLVGGVTSGVTGVIRTPLQSYNEGSGVMTGVGRGLLGVVGLPLSGALGLVGAMTTGLASSTGLTSGPSVRRRGRQQDGRPRLTRAGLAQQLTKLSLRSSILAYAQEVTLVSTSTSDGHPTEQLVEPCTDAVLLLTHTHLMVVNAQMHTLFELQLRGISQVSDVSTPTDEVKQMRVHALTSVLNGVVEATMTMDRQDHEFLLCTLHGLLLLQQQQ